MTNREAPGRAEFEGALHSRFRVLDDGGASADVTLAEVEHRPSPEGWDCFSLLFAGPHPAAFTGGTFTIEHDALGTFLMHIAPVHTPGGGQHYESVFNRQL